ncbi:FkbM family methyltransferase [uncultured Gammaproteobacteria bacterium]
MSGEHGFECVDGGADWHALAREFTSRVGRYQASAGHDWRTLEEPETRGRELTGRPLALLGAGSPIARPFVLAALERCDVRILVDNHRQGQSLNGHRYVCDKEFIELAATTPNLLTVICPFSSAAWIHFETLTAKAGVVSLPLFLACRRLGLGRKLDHSLWGGFCDPETTTRLVTSAADLAERLEDDLGRATLYALLLFRLSWSMAWPALVRRPEAERYFSSQALEVGPNEVLVDGGAFTGDTVAEFLAATGGLCRHIHAFEPDPEIALAFQRQHGHRPEITLHRAGLWSHAGELRFDPTNTPGSGTFDQGGGVSVPVEAIDGLEGPPPTVIKLDVEGAEPEALAGAARVITQTRPKLAVACYHRPNHLIDLALSVLALRPDYRITLRHYDPILFDTILYAW